MPTFQIQNSDGTLLSVSHKEFYETLNGEGGYLYYKRGGKHIAMLPNAENAETIRVHRQAENSESTVRELENRCRDEKGRPCRYQHDANGSIIRNSKGLPVYAKCGDCPRDGWAGGKRENCCIRNYCKTADCVYCPHPRECHAPHSLEWLTENKRDGIDNENGGFFITDPDSDTQAALERDELESALLAALSNLPPKERSVLKAIYWDKLSRRACALELGLSPTTVNRLHDNALESLKNSLKNFR